MQTGNSAAFGHEFAHEYVREEVAIPHSRHEDIVEMQVRAANSSSVKRMMTSRGSSMTGTDGRGHGVASPLKLASAGPGRV